MVYLESKQKSMSKVAESSLKKAKSKIKSVPKSKLLGRASSKSDIAAEIARLRLPVRSSSDLVQYGLLLGMVLFGGFVLGAGVALMDGGRQDIVTQRAMIRADRLQGDTSLAALDMAAALPATGLSLSNETSSSKVDCTPVGGEVVKEQAIAVGQAIPVKPGEIVGSGTLALTGGDILDDEVTGSDLVLPSTVGVETEEINL